MAQDSDTMDAQIAETTPRFKQIYSDDRLDRVAQQGYYGFMYTPEYEWSAQRCIREAYSGFNRDARPGNRRNTVDGQLKRSLLAYTDWLDMEAAAACLGEIPPYNRFRSESVVRALRSVDAPFRVVVGRESSPVMYVWTHDAPEVMAALRALDESDEEPGRSPDELGAVPNARYYPIRTVGQPASEVDAGEPAMLRCWWD